LKFDEGLSILGWSPPFVFRHHGIEFCAGLARDGNRLLATFGVQDCEAWMASFDLAQARRLIVPLQDMDEESATVVRACCGIASG
jgi:hypothetical protein